MTQVNHDSQESQYVPQFSEKDRREVFVHTFPELAHISPSSSQEERSLASRKLNVRLGIPEFSGIQ